MLFKRRQFIKSFGLGTLSLSTIPEVTNGPIAKLFPLLVPAEEIIPGMPYWYASTCRECPVGCGVMLKVREGNVIKVEGNPNHPISKGGLCPRGQAALQELYNFDRIKKPLMSQQQGPQKELEWTDAITQIKEKMSSGRSVLLAGKLSGSQRAFVDLWLRSISNASLVEYEPFIRLSYVKANQILFNKNVPTKYFLDRADYVLSFGADFMETWQSPVGLAGDFAKARKFENGRSAKFAYVGIADSLTAANADEQYQINPTSEAIVFLALAKRVLEGQAHSPISSTEKNQWLNSLNRFSLETAAAISGLTIDTLAHLSDELLTHDHSIVLCGDGLAAHERGTDSQIAVNILNYVCGNYGKTVTLSAENNEKYNWSSRDFEAFVESLEAGLIDNLFIYHTNPIFTYPDSERLQFALAKVALKVALATTPNETNADADFVLPVHHAIETWGIEEPEKGVYSLVQPAMNPVFDSKSMEDILAAIHNVSNYGNNHEQFIRKQWEKIFQLNFPNQSFEEKWQELLLKGGVWQDKKISEMSTTVNPGIFSYLQKIRLPQKKEGLSLLVNYSHRFFDGRSANKSWLWELPHSVHHTVWDMPLRIHPRLANKEDLKEGDIVKISVSEHSMEAPILITDEMHPSVIALEIGAGHANFGRIAVSETGNPLRLLSRNTDVLSGDATLLVPNIKLSKTTKWRKLVRLQGSYDQGDRKIIQQVELTEAIRLEKSDAKRPRVHQAEIYPEHKHKLYDWTMVIDLSACNGCGACVMACYAENNVPVVGKHLCSQGREMAWIRIERFEVDGRKRFLPMMCQQCEQAPCETVCPVYATVHNDEGLNVQVYNRCVGTRYCSNNCPYKVRRFNYFPALWPEPTNRLLNPDIYHRPKGVMEKCTFCIHRLRQAKEEAKIEGRLAQDGEVTTACAQSCPTSAITFGNLNDSNSKVAKLVQDFRAYAVFENLNTKPSVIYLKGIRHG